MLNVKTHWIRESCLSKKQRKQLILETQTTSLEPDAVSETGLEQALISNLARPVELFRFLRAYWSELFKFLERPDRAILR
jgi:hypothetical protein